jgi:RNA exonuclease 4
LGLAFREAKRSQQIGLRLQNAQKTAQQQALKPRTPAIAAAAAAGPNKQRQPLHQKKSPTHRPNGADPSKQVSEKNHHDAPMTKRDLYFCLRCGTVGIGPGGTDVAVGRVTLVNWENQVVFDTFVKVSVRVTDYRTAETGITAQALCSEKAQELEDVRAKVSVIIKGKIMIGHGLEMDLLALGVVHPWCDVRDTANYAPYMKQVIDPLLVMLLPRDLQDLATDVLNRDISETNGEPIEDAICCLDLYKAARSEWEASLISGTKTIHLLASTMSPRESDKLILSETVCSAISASAGTSSKRAVSFGLIQIREYTRVVGDNPNVRFGPPISIGWEFVQKQALQLDVYESRKRWRREPLLMNSIHRRSMLRVIFDVPAEDIRAAEKEVRKIQKQRLQTLNQGTAGRVVENAMQSAKRRFRRTFSSDHLLDGFANSNGGLIPMSV